MVDKENSSNKRKELSLSGKELDPWLRRRLAKSTLMYALLPVMLTRHPAPRLAAKTPLVAPETPGIPLFQDTAFSGKKSDRASIFWSKIGFIWLTNSRKSQGTLNEWSNSFSENMPETNRAWPAPIYRSNSQLTNHLRKDTLQEKTESKVTSASGIIPPVPGKKPLITKSPAQVKTDLSRTTHTTEMGYAGNPVLPARISKPAHETGSPPHLHPGQPTPEMEHSTDSVLHAPNYRPGDNSGFKISAQQTCEIIGNDRAVTGIRQSEAAAVKRTEPSTGLPKDATGQSVFKTGHPEPETKPVEHMSGQDKPAVRHPSSTAGQAKPTDRQSEYVYRPSKHTARKFEPVARHFVPAARQSKAAAGLPISLSGKSKTAVSHLKPENKSPESTASHFVTATEQSMPEAEKHLPPAKETVFTTKQSEPAVSQPEAVIKQAEPAIRQPEPAALHMPREAGYSESEAKHKESVRLYPDRPDIASTKYQPINLMPVSTSFPGSVQPGKISNAGDLNLPEALQKPKPQSLSYPVIDSQKAMTPAVRPLTRQSGFQVTGAPLSLPEASGSAQYNASSGKRLPPTIKVSTETSRGLGIKKHPIIIKNQTLQLKNTGEKHHVAIPKKDSPIKNVAATTGKSNTRDNLKDTSSGNLGPSALIQEQRIGSPEERKKQENPDTGLPLVKADQSTREAPLSQPATGRKQTESLTSQTSKVHPADLFTPRSLQFVADITHTAKPKPESKFPNSREDTYRAVEKNATSLLFDRSQNRSTALVNEEKKTAGQPVPRAVDTFNPGDGIPVSGISPANFHEAPGMSGRTMDTFNPEVKPNRSRSVSIPGFAGKQPTPGHIASSRQSIPAPISRKGTNILKTEKPGISVISGPDTSVYPQAGKPADVTRLELPLAAAVRPPSFHEGATGGMPVRNMTGKTPASYQAVERPASPGTYSPPRAIEINEFEAEHTNSNGSGQTADQTDLKALAREVYPFIKRMIIVDRERMSL